MRPVSSPSNPTSFPKDRIKVLLLENIHPSAHELFRSESVPPRDAPGRAERGRARRAHRGRPRPRHPQQDADHRRASSRSARRLLTVGCFCIGTNQVDLAGANRRGIPVFNAPFSNTRSVAELIVAEIVMLSRHLGDRVREMHAGQWRKVATGSLRDPRQDARHRRLRPHRPAGRRPRRGRGDARRLLRHRGPTADGQQPRDQDARRAPRAERLRHAPRAGDAADARHVRRARGRSDARGELPAQREPGHRRRHRRARRGARERPRRRRGDRRVPRGAGEEQRRVPDARCEGSRT